MLKHLWSVLRCSLFLFVCWNFLHAQSTTLQLPTATSGSDFTVTDNNNNVLMKVLGNGRVGIGIASPNEPLEVASSTAIISDGGGTTRRGLLLVGPTSSSDYARIESFFYPSTGKPLVINNSGQGKVGIWTTNPQQALHVNGTIYSSSGGFKFPDSTIQTTAAVSSQWTSSGSNIYYNAGKVGIGAQSIYEKFQIGDLWTFTDKEEKIIAYNFWYREDVPSPERKIHASKPASRMIFTPQGDIKFQSALISIGATILMWSEGLTVKNDGNVGIGTSDPGVRLQVGVSGDGSGATANAWNTFSDRRFKKNIHPLADALEKTQRLKGVEYQWRKNGETSIGFIAQEVEHVVPEIVLTDERGYKSLDYSKLTPLLVEAVKELSRRLQQQQKTTESLEQKVRDELSEIRKQQHRIEELERMVSDLLRERRSFSQTTTGGTTQ